jgi:ferrochelatase
MSGGPHSIQWIGPTVEDTITGLHESGHTAVIVQPIGFVCDHVEILYDIDVAFRDFAKDKGMTLARPESLNTSPEFIACLADIARSRMKVAA